MSPRHSGAVNWNLNWAKLTSITGYQINRGTYESDLTPLYDFLLASFGVGATPFGLPVSDTTKKFTEEVRLASPDNKNFEWVLGAYYDNERTDESVDLVDGATANVKLPVYNACRAKRLPCRAPIANSRSLPPHAKVSSGFRPVGPNFVLKVTLFMGSFLRAFSARQALEL